MSISPEKLDDIRNCKVFLKMLLMFIFTGYTNTAKNIFIRNCYMFTIGMCLSENLKLSIFWLLMKKFASLLSFTVIITLMKMASIFLRKSSFRFAILVLWALTWKRKETPNIFGWMNTMVLAYIFLSFTFIIWVFQAEKELSDDNVVEKSSLFEIVVEVFYLSQYGKMEGNIVQKCKFIRNGMNSLKNSEFNTHNCIMKKFSILSEFTFLASACRK